MKQTKNTSWGVITCALIFFWPIGIYLLIRRFNNDKAATFQHSKGLKITSYILMGFGALAMVMTLSGQMTGKDSAGVEHQIVGAQMIPYLLISAMFLLGGIILFNKMRKIDKNSVKYKRYINLVVNNQLSEISKIASALSLSSSQVTHDLQSMIDNGYLANAYIDRSRNQIILTQKPVNQGIDTAALETYVCSSCGAKNEIYAGSPKVCEYCGTVLK
ncbi:Rpo12/RPC10 RNA polymerase subunit family protein [Beduini massiliensis]|uniref:hypothetical protein n=1 Tax=Beduini massiliensis TaxID=1585974 RepID=UPI00059A9B13|nr:hypothetical protein [Beduini massiliensis]